MSRPKRENLIRQFLSELPPDATEAERAVYVETQLGERVTLVVSSAPFAGIPEDGTILETVRGIRKRTVENVLRQTAAKYPSAHIALFSTSDESGAMPIYVRS